MGKGRFLIQADSQRRKPQEGQVQTCLKNVDWRQYPGGSDTAGFQGEKNKGMKFHHEADPAGRGDTELMGYQRMLLFPGHPIAYEKGEKESSKRF